MNDRAQTSRVLVGTAAVLGMVGALAVLPRARNTAVTQVALAVGHRPEWMRAAYVRPDGRPEQRIQRVLAAHPRDIELHIGAATLPSFLSVGTDIDLEEVATRRRDSTAGILSRLQKVAERFPDSAAVCAHQLRYLCADAVVIRRPEEQQVDRYARRRMDHSRPAKPVANSLERFLGAAEAGQRMEPQNGFFDTMLAVAAFAVRQDEAAKRHLHQAAAKAQWNDYYGQERQSQWALLERTYGARGWLQKIPAGLTAFDAQAHFRAINSAVNLAMWHAWQQQRAGRVDRVWAIRRDVMQLGLRLQATPETLRLGLVLFDAGSHRIPKDYGPWQIYDHRKLRAHLLSPYLSSLKKHGQTAELEWVLAKSRQTEEGWQQVNEADWASGNRPGWVELCLGVGWAGGLVLLKQMAGLGLFWLGVLLLGQFACRGSSSAAAGRAPALLAYALVFLAPVVVMAAVGPGDPGPGTLEAGITAFALVLLGALWLSMRLRNRSRQGGVELGAGAWIALFLTASLAPLYLIAIYGPVSLMWGYLAGVVVLGMVSVVGARRGREASSVRSEGRPWLTAALAVVGTALSLALAMPLLLRTEAIVRVLQVYPLGGPTEGSFDVVLVAILLPTALLVFLQLCRAAALRLPLLGGVLGGLRRTTPCAIVLLAVLYVATLLPTVAAERAVEEQLIRSVAGDSI
jgi:hypothetical protein